MTSQRFNYSTRNRIATRLAAALLVGTAAGALAVAPAYAQEAASSLRGTINTGGDTTATQVVAVNVETGYRQSVRLESNGEYNFASLQPGTYRLEIATTQGLRTTDEFSLSVGQDAELSFDLAAPIAPEAVDADPAADTSNVIIVTSSMIRTMEGGEIGTNITKRMIEQLPQNNRNFLAFADLAPGVQFVTNAGGQSRLQGGAQNSRTINVFIDGVGQKDYVLKNGITGQDSTQGNPFPQSAIGEYRVISSNYKAEFSQVSSVAITAITKSGTNEFHGSAFVDYSDQSLRARTPLEEDAGGPKTETRDFQFGATLGGPIIKDKLHFFLSYEGKRNQEPREVIPGGGLSASDFPTEYQSFFGTFNSTFNENLYFGKIDFVPSEKDLFEVSAKYRDETGVGFGGGISATTTSTDTNTDDLRLLARYEHTEDNWINDLRLTYEDASWAPTPRVFENGFTFQNANNQSLLRVGGSANFQDKGQKGFGIQNDFTWIGFDDHTIKGGISAKWVKLESLQLNFTNPDYTFNTEFNPNGGTFNDEIPYRVRFGAATGSGEPIVTSDNFQFGIYIQDDWDVTDRLTLNLGVRWDYEETPAYLDFVTDPADVAALSPANYPNLYQGNAGYDINDFISTGSEREPFMGAIQPRIGFSYELDEEANYVLFGGYGRSYDRNQFDFIQQEISAGSFQTRTFNFITGDPLHTCNPGPTCVPFDPIYFTEAGRQQLLDNAGPGGATGIRLINNDLKIPYSDQFSLGVRSRFGLLDAEVGFSHIESKDGFAYILGNRFPDGEFFPLVDSNGDGVKDKRAVFGGPFGQGPSGFGNLIVGVNGIETSADSAYIKLVKRYTTTSPWSIHAVYTYTQAEENRKFGEFFSFDYPSIDAYPVLRSAGVSKHRIVVAGSVDLPFKTVLSGKLLLESPPYIYGIGMPGDPPRLGDPRAVEAKNKNSFILGDLWATRQIDLALTKYIPLDFLYGGSEIFVRMDVLNVLNTENFTQYNGNGRSENFATRTVGPPQNERLLLGVGGNPPRTFKFSVGFRF